MKLSLSKPMLIGAIVFAALLGVAAIGRLAPHAPNFAPMLGVALFAGFFFRRWWVALLAPMVAMAATDAVIGFYDWRILAVVYAAIAGAVGMRYFLRKRFTALRLASCTLTASIAFFGLTNLAVWAFSGMYAPTLEGLGACFAAAIPFFKYGFAGDIFYTTGLFGTWALAQAVATRRARSLAPAA